MVVCLTVGDLSHAALEPRARWTFRSTACSAQMINNVAPPDLNSYKYVYTHVYVYLYTDVCIYIYICVYSRLRRLQQVGRWMWDDFCWLGFFPGFGVGGQSCSNFLASTVGPQKATWLFVEIGALLLSVSV